MRDRKATVAPVILSSDKTQLTNFSGDKSAYPVYITIGNLSRRIRRQPTQHGTYLLCYLPVTKLDIFSDKDERKRQIDKLFHTCIKKALEPLLNAGNNGVLMLCADGYQRRVYPILASYAADFPEQCLISCCKQSYCPICKVDPADRGELLDQTKIRYRAQREILTLLKERDQTGFSVMAEVLGVTATYVPFWEGLPYCNIFTSITPDELHQFNGTVKDHLLKWFTHMGGSSKLDSIFKSIPSMQGLRHFHRGISHVSQWTGREVKELQRVMLGAVCGLHLKPGKSKKSYKALSAFLEYIFLSHLPNITKSGIHSMKRSLTVFHENKDVFLDEKMCKNGFKNIPKFHTVQHYPFSIKEFGTCDGYSTGQWERLHKDFAKGGYLASNRVNPLPQMAVYMDRHDALHLRSMYFGWLNSIGEQNLRHDRSCAGPESSPLPSQSHIERSCSYSDDATGLSSHS